LFEFGDYWLYNTLLVWETIMSMSNSNPIGFSENKFSSDFISFIKAEIRRGFSVTPFLGSGISAASGIMMGMDFDH